MKKEIKVVDKERGIFRITCVDARWYAISTMNKNTELPEYSFLRSVTWITSYLPKGVEYERWLASKGWDEAQRIKEERGEEGDKVHQAVELLTFGEVVKSDSKFANADGDLEELNLAEYEAILSFSNWYKKVKPKILQTEKTIINEAENYAGTLDMVCEIEGVKYIVDLKTSKNIYDSHKAQVSAYKHAGYEDCKLAILQLGYKRNKDGYKFTEIEDHWELFQAANVICKIKNAKVTPEQKDYPLEISLK